MKSEILELVAQVVKWSVKPQVVNSKRVNSKTSTRIWIPTITMWSINTMLSHIMETIKIWTFQSFMMILPWENGSASYPKKMWTMRSAKSTLKRTEKPLKLSTIRLSIPQEQVMLLLSMAASSTSLLELIPIVEQMTCINLILKLSNGIRYFKPQAIAILITKWTKYKKPWTREGPIKGMSRWMTRLNR